MLDINLKGKLLIAMPGLDDPNFAQSVIFICEHTKDGAMGFVINKHSDDISLSDLFNQLSIPLTDTIKSANARTPVRIGGPCHPNNGFIVFPKAEFAVTETNDKIEIVDDKHCFSSDLGMLRLIAAEKGPSTFAFVLGFAGWEPGQLEAELMENSWLYADLDEELLYTSDLGSIWRRAIMTLGIEPAQLSAMAGTA